MTVKPPFSLKEEFSKPCPFKWGAVLLGGGLAVSLGLSTCLEGGMKMGKDVFQAGAEACGGIERAVHDYLLRQP